MLAKVPQKERTHIFKKKKKVKEPDLTYMFEQLDTNTLCFYPFPESNLSIM